MSDPEQASDTDEPQHPKVRDLLAELEDSLIKAKALAEKRRAEVTSRKGADDGVR